jgi:uncharacterized membrane protein
MKNVFLFVLLFSLLTACTTPAPTSTPTPLTSLTLSPTNPELVVGSTQQFTATALDADGQALSDVTFSWETSDGAVALVDSNGMVSAVAVGNSDITVSAQGLSQSATLTVTNQSTTQPGFTLLLEPATLDLARDTTQTVTVKLGRTGGFAGTVQVTVANLPSGVTAPELTIPENADSATLTLSASAAAPPGDTTLTVAGSSNGLLSSAVLLLNVLETPATPDFSFSVAPTSLSIQKGSTANVAVSMTRSGGFAEAVDVSLVNPPSGISGSTSLAAGATTGLLELVVSNGASLGTQKFIVKAKGGSIEKTVELSLTVTSTPPAPDFGLSLSPNVLSLEQGKSSQITINLSKLHGFDSATQLSLLNAPSGISAADVMVATGSASATLTVAVASSVSPGTKTLTVQGVSGSLTRTATLDLTVTAAPTPDFALTVNVPGTVQQGSSLAITVNVLRLHGFNGAVAVSLLNPPNRIGATPITIPAGSNSATLTLDVGPSVSPGATALTLYGRSGGLSHEFPFQITVTAAPPPADFSFSLSPASATMVAGSSGQITVNIQGQNGFNDAVEVTTDPALAGVIGAPALTIPAAAQSGTVQTGTLQVAVATTASSQTYSVTVTAKSGSLQHTATLTVNVLPIPVADFSLGFSGNSSFTLQQGLAAQVGSVMIARQNTFTDPVTLALEGSIVGTGADKVAADFPGNPVAGTSAFLNLLVGATVPPGTYPLTVRGTSGTINQTLALSLTVFKPPFTFALSPNDVSVPKGSSRSITVTLNREAGFTDAVNLESGQANGTTITFNPNPVTGNTTTLTITAAPDAPVGVVYPTLGSTNLNPNVYVAYTLRVVQPDFSIGVEQTINPFDPGAIPVIPQGVTRNLTVRVFDAGNGFDQKVDLSLTGLPSGISASFNPASIAPGDVSTLSLSVAANVAPGDYTFSISGQNDAVGTRTKSYTVHVASATLLEEYFTSTSMPSGWVVTNGGNGPSTWRLVSSASPPVPLGSVYMRAALQGGAPDTTMDEYLSTPAFDVATSFCNIVKLKFAHAFNADAAGTISVEASNNNGASWTKFYDLSIGDMGTLDLTVPNQAIGGTQAKLRFRYLNTSLSASGFWGIDNVVVTCQ